MLKYLALALCLAGPAAAQDLPCGPVEETVVRFTWRAPAQSGAGVIGYGMRRYGGAEQYPDEFLLDHSLTGDNDIFGAEVAGFWPDQSYRVQIYAITADGGYSALSGELAVPALVRGPCPMASQPRELAFAGEPGGTTWPDSTTTGPRASAVLTACAGGGITTSKTGCIFDREIVIAADNVTITDSVVPAHSSANYAVSDGGTPRTGTVLDHVRIHGASGKCIYLPGGFTGDALEIYGCEDGVYGWNFTLRNSYIRDLLTGGDRHSDGVQIPSTGGVVLTGNRIEVANGAANAAVLVQSNFNRVDGVRIEGNKLAGGTYTVYTDAQGHACPINVRWLGNTFVRGSSAFGAANVPCKTADGFEWSGNVYDDGAAVPLP